MKPKAQERGQALVIIALAAIGLFGFSALAIDGSRVFSDRRHAQNAADTSALSAALAKIRAEDYVQAAKDRAEDNGYIFDANSNVEVNLCNVSGLNPPCQGIPTQTSTPPTAEELELINPANYIQVKITSVIPATFARIIGRNEFTNILTAIAYAGPVEPKPLVDGYAIAAMELHDWDAINHTGNFNLDVNNSGIFSNSDYVDTHSGPNCPHGSISSGGNGTISVDTSIQTAGSFCQGNNPNIQAPAVNEEVSQIDMPLPVDIPNFSCSGQGSTSYNPTTFILTYHPGSFGNLNPDNDLPPGTPSNAFVREAHFSPGTYCFTGANFNRAPIVADGVRFLITGGELKFNGSQLTCNDLQVHINGGSGISFSATSHIYCNNVTFFLSTGGVTWTGNPEYRMYAPTGGDYEGLLFYLPPSNSNPLSLRGNSSCEMTGTILAVSSKITVNGNNWSTGLNSQIIGDTVELAGNGNMVINFDPDDQYQPIDPSSIMLTK